VHITPVTPTQATTPSADGPIGSTTISDTDTVSGAFGAAGTSDVVAFNLYGPFTSTASISCTVTPAYNETNDQLTGGTAGTPNHTWTASTTPFTPTKAGYYAWTATADFSGDPNNNDPTPNPTACTGTGSEIVHITPVNPTLTTLQSSPSSISVDTTASISDAGTLHNFVLLQSGDTMTFSLYGPFTGTPTCDTTNNTNRVLGPFTGTVNTTTGVAGTGPQNFTPSAAGTYYWVATFSGDLNNTPANATNVGCGDSHEAVVVTVPPPSAQITPTGTTCQQYIGGTASTLSTVVYSTKGSTISSDNPGVFFYYERVTVAAGTNSITVTEGITSTNTFPSGESKYLLPVLNSSTSQVILYDAQCNTIGGTKVLIGPTASGPPPTYPVTINTPSLPAGTYIFSIKYTPKTLVGLGAPTPTTIVYSFSASLNGAPISGSTQGISAKHS
jgi:hypothetical protein